MRKTSNKKHQLMAAYAIQVVFFHEDSDDKKAFKDWHSIKEIEDNQEFICLSFLLLKKARVQMSNKKNKRQAYISSILIQT